jgi:WD40 repeat protein
MVPAITLWDTTTSAEIQTLVMRESVYNLQFSPDEMLLATAVSNDLQLWDPTSGSLLNTLSGHSDIILQIAISPDQHSIATAGLDNQLFLWQIIE